MPEEPTSYIIEFVRIGQQVKVTACDPESGIEAVIFGPTQTPKKMLSNLAIKKLLYVMAKKNQEPPN
jgi:hypothetical protein